MNGLMLVLIIKLYTIALFYKQKIFSILAKEIEAFHAAKHEVADSSVFFVRRSLSEFIANVINLYQRSEVPSTKKNRPNEKNKLKRKKICPFQKDI